MIVVYAMAFVLWSTFGHANAETRRLVSDLVSPLTAIVGTVWSLWDLPALLRARRSGRRAGALSAALLSLSMGLYAAGACAWSYTELVLRSNAFPSWAEAGHLSSFVLLVAAIFLLPARRLPALVRLRLLVDGLTAMVALVTFSWFFILGPAVLSAQGGLLAKILAPLYPVLDLAMLFGVMVMAVGVRDPGLLRVRNLLTVGVCAFVASDLAFGLLSLRGTYQSGNPFDAGWLVGNLVVGQAALVLRGRHRELADLEPGDPALAEVVGRPSSWRMLLPYTLVPAVGALLAYVWRERLDLRLETGVNVGAGVLVALILLRQAFAIAENTRLYGFLQQAYRELEALATIDAMTGLWNHRMFQERLRAATAAADEDGTPVTLLLVDVDRFKAYNDRFGHPAGDQALKKVARVLRESVRATDLPARYGGEEFAVILPDTTAAAAMAVAERIRALCERTEFPHRAVTLSVGVAQYRQGRVGELVEAADQALYAAKHGGRNQVVCEGAPVDDPGLTLVSGGVPDDPLPPGLSLESLHRTGADRLVASTELLAGPGGPLVRALLGMLDLRDHAVERHSDRVMRNCLRLAEEAMARGVAVVSKAEMNDLHLGALLHDIGKVGVPDAILHKPDALSEEEWTVVRRHPIQGADLLAGFPQLAGAVPIVRSHHERWDGTGYPDGLAGRAIPLGARLFALADTLDAMASDRPYRKARPYAEIRDEVRRMSGHQFDPSLVEAFPRRAGARLGVAQSREGERRPGGLASIFGATPEAGHAGTWRLRNLARHSASGS